jgi:uncharacterized protein (DUF2267 family)
MSKVKERARNLAPEEAVMADIREPVDTKQGLGARQPEGQVRQSRRDSGLDLETLRKQRSETRRSQTYKAFLKNLCVIGSMNEEEAERAAVSVLCALEQRLFGEEASHLEAQLPGKLQDLLLRCERHVGKPPRKFGREEFLQMVAEDLELDVQRVEHVVRSVFSAVQDQVSEGEIDDVIHQLPADLRELWHRAI